MPIHRFNLVADSGDVTDEAVEKLFELFHGDVSVSTRAGTPVLRCSIEAESFADAVTQAVDTLRTNGFSVRHVEAVPEAVAA